MPATVRFCTWTLTTTARTRVTIRHLRHTSVACVRVDAILKPCPMGRASCARVQDIVSAAAQPVQVEGIGYLEPIETMDLLRQPGARAEVCNDARLSRRGCQEVRLVRPPGPARGGLCRGP